MRVLVDLHNHSCLSPCGGLDMSPSAMARTAAARGMGVMALTDHNSARNARAFAVSCDREGVLPLFGMELNAREEVHVLVLFGEAEAAEAFGAYVESLLPPVENDPARMGDQVVVDADENILGEVKAWLGSALDLGFDEIRERASEAGALVIPAHIDRPYYGVLEVLGFLPPGPYAAVEALGARGLAAAAGNPVITGSDAHCLEHVGRRAFVADLPSEAFRGGRDLLAALERALAGGRFETILGEPVGSAPGLGGMA